MDLVNLLDLNNYVRADEPCRSNELFSSILQLRNVSDNRDAAVRVRR